jgi:hypothetical protein
VTSGYEDAPATNWRVLSRAEKHSRSSKAQTASTPIPGFPRIRGKSHNGPTETGSIKHRCI